MLTRLLSLCVRRWSPRAGLVGVWLAVAAGCLFAVGAGGCEQKMTADRVSQLKQGMSQSEVQSLLRAGSGTDETSSGFNLSGSGISGSGSSVRVIKYQEGDRSVTVTFREGKAADWVTRGFE